MICGLGWHLRYLKNHRAPKRMWMKWQCNGIGFGAGGDASVSVVGAFIVSDRSDRGDGGGRERCWKDGDGDGCGGDALWATGIKRVQSGAPKTELTSTASKDHATPAQCKERWCKSQRLGEGPVPCAVVSNQQIPQAYIKQVQQVQQVLDFQNFSGLFL